MWSVLDWKERVGLRACDDGWFDFGYQLLGLQQMCLKISLGQNIQRELGIEVVHDFSGFFNDGHHEYLLLFKLWLKKVFNNSISTIRSSYQRGTP